MREILFRGKRADNGEWVCGDLVRHYENQRVFILTEQLAYTTTEYGISRIVSERYLEVIPETVGQYTGMVDRNGKGIYEGDIIRFIKENCLVIFVENDCAFRIEVDGRISTALRKAHSKDYEVIGNIHDEGEDEND